MADSTNPPSAPGNNLPVDLQLLLQHPDFQNFLQQVKAEAVSDLEGQLVAERQERDHYIQKTVEDCNESILNENAELHEKVQQLNAQLAGTGISDQCALFILLSSMYSLRIFLFTVLRLTFRWKSPSPMLLMVLLARRSDRHERLASPLPVHPLVFGLLQIKRLEIQKMKLL
jgi:hypothetical protein